MGQRFRATGAVVSVSQGENTRGRTDDVCISSDPRSTIASMFHTAAFTCLKHVFTAAEQSLLKATLKAASDRQKRTHTFSLRSGSIGVAHYWCTWQRLCGSALEMDGKGHLPIWSSIPRLWLHFFQWTRVHWTDLLSSLVSCCCCCSCSLGVKRFCLCGFKSHL